MIAIYDYGQSDDGTFYYVMELLPGMSLERAYEFVADKKGTTVIVGIVASGIDITHEDLKDLV